VSYQKLLKTFWQCGQVSQLAPVVINLLMLL
jgi:hypothetical protein